MSAVSSRTAERGQRREKSGIVFRYEDRLVRFSNRQRLDRISEPEPSRWGVEVKDYTERPPELPIPGTGEAYDDCGESMPTGYCDRCGDPLWGSRRCKRSTCPECWESWDKQQSVSIASKIDGRRRYEEACTPPGVHSGQKFHHLTVSLPDSFRVRSDQPLERTKELVKLACSEAGAEEGVVVYHPWRIKAKFRGSVNGHQSGDGEMTWKDVLALVDELGWEIVCEKFLVYAPHFHVLALSEYVMGSELTANIEEKTGLVVHRITKGDSSVSLYGLEDLVKATAYCLSHAGIRETESGQMRAAYWYFGQVSNFSASEGVEADVSRVFNKVGGKVLGVGFGRGRCRKPSEGVNNELDGDDGEVPEEFDEGLCNGKYRPISEARDRLRDREWLAGARYVEELAAAYTEWLQEPAAPEPEPDPPPD